MHGPSKLLICVGIATIPAVAIPTLGGRGLAGLGALALLLGFLALVWQARRD